MAFDTDSGEEGAISGINVTPLVDVMLVLLVIFMVTAPILQHGVDVQLPRANAGPVQPGADALIVSVNDSGAVFVGDQPVSTEALGAMVTAALSAGGGEGGDRAVYVRGDGSARYGAVVEVIAILRRNGVRRLGLITEPGGQG